MTHKKNIKNGFLMVNRNLLFTALDQIKEPFNEDLAFLTMIMMAYYTTKMSKGELFQRGESDGTLTRLAHTFHWPKSKTHRFIRALTEKKRIIIHRAQPFKWSIPDYD